MTAAVPRRWILVWLGSPAVVFLLGFVSPGFGVPLVALLLAAAWPALRHRGDGVCDHKRWGLALIGALVLLVLVGFPHGPFAWDWIKHWALLDTLVREPWPVSVELRGTPAYLRFYIGAYLVPALVAPRTGAALALGAWFGAGYLLLLRGASLASPRGGLHAAAAMLLFLAAAGADLAVQTLLRALHGAPTAIVGIHAENWWVDAFGDQLQLTGVLATLLWVPHQAIATGLFVVLLLYDQGRAGLGAAVLAFGFLALWSPFGMVGALPLLVVHAWQQRRLLSPAVWLAAAAATAFGLLMAWILTFEAPSAGACLPCAPARLETLPRMLLFWGVELVFFVLVLGRRLWSDPICRTALLSILGLCFLHGETTDLVMRASLAPIAVLTLRSVQVLLPAAPRKLPPAALLALALTLPTTASEAAYHLSHGAAHRALPERDRLRQTWMVTFAERTDYTAEQFFDRCGWRYRQQYFSGRPPPAMKQR